MNAGEMFNFPLPEAESQAKQTPCPGTEYGERDFDDEEDESRDDGEQHPQGEVELMQWADTLVQDPAFFEVVKSKTSASIFPQVIKLLKANPVPQLHSPTHFQKYLFVPQVV